ncbi:MAG: GntR family transcriptional regulator [Planctomycetota bacterium]
MNPPDRRSPPSRPSQPPAGRGAPGPHRERRPGAGERLPSVRALAADVLVNPNTVRKAYRDLEALGVAAGRTGSGVYVTDDARERPRAAPEARPATTSYAPRKGAARAAGPSRERLADAAGVEPAVASENER